MYKRHHLVILLLIAIQSTYVFAQKNDFLIHGRVEKLTENKIALIGSGSSIEFNFSGNSCNLFLQTTENHNYVALELDGKYIGRIKIEKGEIQTIPIKIIKTKKTHHLLVFKATEATNGSVIFSGTTAKLAPIQSIKRKKIEFIGNSITCGFGNDASTTPCSTGEWFDQHNAYWAYGPILSRSLDFDFLLSSVSGIGMYRNWNDEHLLEPIMPDVYENLYLNKDNSKPYNFDFQPDIVSICLGTNDLSDGDGKKTRLPFELI